MSSISKHQSGYRAQVYVQGVRDSSVFRTKREAEAWACSREVELRTRAASLPGELHTFSELLRRYAEEVSPTKRGERWERIRIEALLRDPLLCGAERVGRITSTHLSEWRDARLKQVSAGTVLREIGLLSDALEVARREWRWIEANPMRDVRKPRTPDHRQVTLTRQQVRAMLLEMGYSPRQPVRSVSQATAVCMLAALRTGMRAGELCGLTWTRVRDGYCVLDKTKTVARNVPLTAKAMNTIERMRGFDEELVFGLQVQTLDALFRKYRKRAGLSGFTFHDTRHTAATWIAGRMRSNDVPAQQAVFDLCKMFGWSNVNQALVYYNPSAADIAKRIR